MSKMVVSDEVEISSRVVTSSPLSDSVDLSDENSYPEGGLKAWSVVLGAWCAMVPSMGLLNSLGVLQAWTSTHQLKDYSESSIGWIYGSYAFFLYIAGAQMGLSTLHISVCAMSLTIYRSDLRYIWLQVCDHPRFYRDGGFHGVFQFQRRYVQIETHDPISYKHLT
jgi:hypothetical protein